MKKRQAYNPFLPLHEYIPDGEPHVFGDRVYHYGSHDAEGGHTFCMEDYVVYSAPIDDLTDWRYEGVSYRAKQDGSYPNPKYMYAPDVVKGNDGKYYLYYCMALEYGYGGYAGPISVAKSDSPAGPFEFVGYVKYQDGTIMKKYVCFDPAVLNDDGVIRLYYGTQYDYEEREDFDSHPEYLKEEAKMFWKSEEEILEYRKCHESCKDIDIADGFVPDSINGAVMAVLADDMMTIVENPHHIIPYRVKGTSFEEHPFFEGPSMRKVGQKYYFIYSSWLNHELCYAVSDYPDCGFTFGGTIVSNGDIGYLGRSENEKLNMTGTTHGSIIEINGQWYVFYHRLTHKSDYSRQACAEKIYFDKDGKISQVEVTSCGLNNGPLMAMEGYSYPAVIACNLTNGNMPHGSNSIYQIPFPNVTNIGDDRFIGEIEDGTLIGFKYFQFENVQAVKITARMENDDNRVVYSGPLRVDERSDVKTSSDDLINGSHSFEGDPYFEIRLKEDGDCIGKVMLTNGVYTWNDMTGKIDVPDGVFALYLIYHGNERAQLKEISFV